MFHGNEGSPSLKVHKHAHINAIATNLGQTVHKCHGKEEVSVGTPSMYPEVPEDWAQHRCHQEHGDHHKSVAKV